MSRYLNNIAVSAPAIVYNGAAIYDFAAQKFVRVHYLDGVVRELIAEIMREFPECGAEVMFEDKLCVVRMNEQTEYHINIERQTFTSGALELLPQGWLKALFAAEAPVITKILDYVASRQKSDRRWRSVDIYRTNDIYCELLPHKIGKKSALAELAQYLQIKKTHTCAVGDYYNDIDLLDGAAFAGAVSEAPNEVKKQADIVVAGCMEGGVAEFLQAVEKKFA